MRLIDADDLTADISSMRVYMDGKDITDLEYRESVLMAIAEAPTVDAIAPPVKVGQTVWYIDRYTGNIETDTVKYLTVTKSGIHAQLVYHNQKFWDIYRQGKDVFFTREAAETALKAMEKQ